jgi:large subunit ribosomal protein L25
MSEVTLAAETGRTIGSRSSGRIRTEGRVPAVMYGHGIDPKPISVVRRDLRAALHTDAGLNAVINLQIDGDQHLTIVKDLQRHPVRNDVVHVDFLIVRRDEVVTVDVPILLEGESAKVKEATGTVDQQLFALTVKTTPGNIPNELTIDVSEMDIGDSIRVGDVRLPSGVETEIDPEEPIAIAQVTRATIEAEELEEAAAAEAELAEGAEGETEDTAQAGDVGETEETAEGSGD